MAKIKRVRRHSLLLQPHSVLGCIVHVFVHECFGSITTFPGNFTVCLGLLSFDSYIRVNTSLFAKTAATTNKKNKNKTNAGNR